jgi:hypothetical protein
VERIGVPHLNEDRIVFLYRDPRDTVVSYFYETTIRQKPNWHRSVKFWLQGRNAPQEINQLVKSGRFGIEKVIVFNLLCAEHLRALPVAYEALREDTIGSLAEILRYIDRPVPEHRIRQTVENNTFAKMRNREANNEYGNRGLQARDPSNPNTYKVRRGKIGGWRDELDLQTQGFVNEMLEKYDYFTKMDNILSKKRSMISFPSTPLL